MRVDLTDAIDWLSVKLSVGGSCLAVITGNQVLMGLSGIMIVSTIVYNTIRIIKELKRKK